MSLFRRRRPTPVLPLTPSEIRTGYSDLAAEKAGRLLWSKLTYDQRLTFPLGYFDVRGSLGGLYRIYTSSTTQNIVSGGFARGRVEYCVGPARRMPRSDVWLCQKLLIESDEGRFLYEAVPYHLDSVYRAGW